MTRFQKIVRKYWLWAVPLVALLMLGLMLLPANVWHYPANDAVYTGFDSNLIYVDETGYAPSQGIVNVSTNSLTLTALPSSQPTVDLVTTPLESFDADMDIRVLENQTGTDPLKIGLWSPMDESGYFIEFGNTPENLITTQTIVGGSPAQTLVGGTVIKQETLGTYSLGQLYHLDLAVDKEAGTISSILTSQESPPSDTPMLQLVGGPSNPEYGDIVSGLIPVEGGHNYNYGGLVKLISGSDSYKIVVQWIDKDNNNLVYSGNWRSVEDLNGWTQENFTAMAPPNAAFAVFYLGAGNDTQYLFANTFLQEAGSSTNLLPNGDFSKGVEGWVVGNQPSSVPQIISPYSVTLTSSLSAEECASLLNSVKLTFAVSASSNYGIAETTLENYTLTIPHQRFFGVKIDDLRAKVLIAVFATLGFLLCLVKVVLWMRQRRKAKKSIKSASSEEGLSKTFKFRLTPMIVWGIVIVFVYLVINVWLFSQGNLPYDILTEKIAAYVAGKYGTSQLYYLTNLVPLAKVWGGGPWAEAAFPLGPPMAYIFTVIGWVQRVFFSGPTGFVMDTFQLEFLIKATNVLFGLASGLLIYLILRELKVSQKWSLIGSSLLLLNPALMLSMSVWGETQIISIFFLLSSIWLAEKKHPAWAWLFLATAGLSRPQFLIPSFLLGIYFLRKFPIKINLFATSYAVIIGFLLLTPLFMSISPSLPVDISLHQFLVQEAGRNEAALTKVSLDAYNIWPLVTHFTADVSGLARISYPSASSLIGALSYQRIGIILTLLVMLAAVGFIIFRHKSTIQQGDYLLMVTLGIVGFLELMTGLGSNHFLMGLPLLILYMGYSRDKFSSLFFIAVWSFITMLIIWASLGYAMVGISYMPLSPFQNNNTITRFIMHLYSSDWFITLGCVANLWVLIWLFFKAIFPGKAKLPPESITTNQHS